MAAGVGDGFDLVSYEMGRLDAGGGGGGDITVESKSISSNGTYTAPAGKAYSPVTVNVPNSYAAGDEGKVVSNGALVAQSSDSVTQNGTVDTTLINSLVVNVSGGGGGYGYTKLAEQDFTVNTSSTTEVTVGTVSCGPTAWTKDKVLHVRVWDKAGPRVDYFWQDVAYLVNSAAMSGQTSSTSFMKTCYKRTSSVSYGSNSSSYGVYPSKLANDGTLTIAAKYSNSGGTIDGAYHVEVYLLDWPDGVGPLVQA